MPDDNHRNFLTRLRSGLAPESSDLFVHLIAIAGEDPLVRDQLLAIVKQDGFHRRSLVNGLIHDLRNQRSAQSLRVALAFLLDDDTAEKARELMEQMKH